jgi:hypothetical protein
VTALYPGDDNVLRNVGRTFMELYRVGPSSTTFTCQASVLTVGDSTVCTATVSSEGVWPDPQGTVTFSEPVKGRDANGFDPVTCTLVDNGDGTSSCSTAYIDVHSVRSPQTRQLSAKPALRFELPHKAYIRITIE